MTQEQCDTTRRNSLSAILRNADKGVHPATIV